MQIFLDENGKTAHLKIKSGDLPKYILSPGSPERVRQIGEFLDNCVDVCDNRGLSGVRGTYKGVEVGAVNTGMGPASASIIVPEIIEGMGDFKNATIIRVGTCGSLQPHVGVGDLIVSKGVIRDEATTAKWVPLEFPAVSSLGATLSLIEAGSDYGYSVGGGTDKNLWVGITHAKDELYAVENPTDTPMGEIRKMVLNSYKKMGTLATEMEFTVFALYAEMYNAIMREQKKSAVLDAGCILLCLSPCHDPNANGAIEFHHPEQKPMLEIALDSLVKKAELDSGKHKFSQLIKGF
jgi:uridine phosphorylase